MVFLMALLPSIPLPIWIYHTILSGDVELFLRLFPFVFIVALLMFLGASMVGMIVNFLISFSAGFFLFLSHLLLRVWNSIRGKSKPPAFCVNALMGAETAVLRPFSYYVSELFLFSLWFVILISSSVPVSIADLWNTIWEKNLLIFLIPMWAFVYLLFLYQLLRTTWGEEPISPKLLRGLWSAFTITVFIAKLFWEGLSFGILSNFFAMFYIVFLFSSGFAIGFIGTSNIALKHALEEITRIGKRYTGVTISSQ